MRMRKTGHPSRQSRFNLRVEDGALLLEDLNLPGTVSITNNAEEIVSAQLRAQCVAGEPPPRILYRDTDGRWDELKHDNVRFTGFAPIDAATRQRYNLVDAS
jgi:hypothetical protein